MEILDNAGQDFEFASDLPRAAFLVARFSKSGHADKSLSLCEVDQESTFPATTVTSTSFSLSFFSLS